MLPRIRRADRPFGVQTVGQRVVDRINVGIGQECLVGRMNVRDAGCACEFLRPFDVATRDSGHGHLRRWTHAFDEQASNIGSAKDADPKTARGGRGHAGALL